MPPNLLLQSALMQGNLIDAMNIVHQEEMKWHYMAAEEERQREEERRRAYKPEPVVCIGQKPIVLEINIPPLLEELNKMAEERRQKRVRAQISYLNGLGEDRREENEYFRMLRITDELRKAEEIRLIKSLTGDNSW